METRFVDYLSHLFHDQDRSLIDLDENREIKPDIIENSKECVRRAADPEISEIGKLGRVFNSFPRKYTKGAETFSAVPDEVWAAWVRRCEKIIREGQRIERSVTGQRSVFLLDDVTQKEIDDFVIDAIIKGIDALLDEDGYLKQGVIDTMGLTSLLEEPDATLENIDDVKHQILYSYCSQIVISNLIAPLYKVLPDEFEKIQIILKVAENLLVDPVTSVFTPFFKDKIAFYTNQKFYRESLWGHCASELKAKSIEEIHDVVASDLDKPALITKGIKIQFWIDVMNVYREQYDECYDPVYISPMKAILGALPEVTDDLREKYDACESRISAACAFERRVTETSSGFEKISAQKLSAFVTEKLKHSDAETLNYWIAVLTFFIRKKADNPGVDPSRLNAIFLALKSAIDNDAVSAGIKRRFHVCEVAIEKLSDRTPLDRQPAGVGLEEKTEVDSPRKIEKLLFARDNVTLLNLFLEKQRLSFEEKNFIKQKIEKKDLIQGSTSKLFSIIESEGREQGFNLPLSTYFSSFSPRFFQRESGSQDRSSPPVVRLIENYVPQ